MRRSLSAAALAQSAGPGSSSSTTVSTQPAAGAGALSPVTAGTANASLTAALSVRKCFFLSNEAPSTGGSIAACPTTVSSPGVDVAGCKTIPPGSYWAPCSPAYCPADAFNVIGAVAGTPATFGQN